MQADPRPSSLGSLLAVLGLITLGAGLVIMLVLPEMRTGAWAVMAVGSALLAIALALDFRWVRGTLTSRRGRFGLGASIMASLFIGITILVNAISIGNYRRIDTSRLSQFTLTPQTIDVLKSLDAPVKAIGFFVPDDPYGIAAYVSSLLNEYEIHARQLAVQYIDPDQHPDQAKEFGITEYQSVVFVGGGRRLTVSPTQFVTIDPDGNVSMKAEHAFTSAILQVTGVAQKRVYFLTGHGEGDIGSNFTKVKEGLLDDLYRVDTLNLLTSPTIPDDCAVLVIAAPQRSLASSEIGLIARYLQGGGQALILTNPGSFPEIEEILSPWGIRIGEGTVVDPASCVSPHQDMPVVPPSRDYFQLPSVYFPGAAAILPQEPTPAQVEMFPLVFTTTSSWLDRNLAAGSEPVFDSETEKMEPLAIGMLVAGVPSGGSATKYTRLVVLGDSDFASDEHFDHANNGDLFLNSVNWLAEETSLVSIRRNVQPFRRLVVTPSQENFIRYSSIGLLPLLVLAVGGVVWWRRR